MSLKSWVRFVQTFGRGVAVGLPRATEEQDPLDIFREWFEAAHESGLHLPEAFALATASAEGRPSARMLLLKGFDDTGFRFFTNYESRKAEELDANPWASMCFHWTVLERQVRIEGAVKRATKEQSEAYFRTRGRGSRIGAWASKQSRDLPERRELEERVADATRRFEGEEVPRPPYWGGYDLEPLRMEFWQGRADRLHDRLVFERSGLGEAWTTRRLYP